MSFMKRRSWFDEIEIGTWNDAIAAFQKCPRHWIFRGHQNAGWELATALERARFRIPLEAAESAMLKTFKSRGHQFLPAPEIPSNDLEWLALMQHCGAPTRLLDWTRSPYVATYFAFENVVDSQPCAVWALNANALRESSITVLNGDGSGAQALPPGTNFSEPAIFDEFVYAGRYGIVVPVEPSRINVRMGTQQGLFLCAGAPDRPFADLLQALLTGGFDRPRKYIFKASARGTVLEDLTRMNITRATLFPGVDGLAQSLKFAIELEGDPLRDVKRRFGV